MGDYKEEIENTAYNLSYLNMCLERYKEENPKDFFRVNAYAQSVLKASIEASKGGDYDLEYENGMDYKQRRAFRSLGEKKPDINKGRPFFNKLGAKIKSVWSKDYGALNNALERIQKDAKRNPQYYAEAIKESETFNGITRISDIAENASYRNDKTNNHYKFTESYRTKEEAKARSECGDVLQAVADAMSAYKTQHPKDARRAELHVMKTLRAYAGIRGSHRDSVVDKIYMPSADIKAKDSEYNLKKGTPSVTKGLSFFKKIGTKLKSHTFAFNAEKQLDQAMAKAVESMKKNRSVYSDVLKDAYQDGEPRSMADIASDAKSWAKSAEKWHEESKRVPLQKQLENVQKALFGNQGRAAAASVKAPSEKSKMSDQMLKLVLKGYKGR